MGRRGRCAEAHGGKLGWGIQVRKSLDRAAWLVLAGAAGFVLGVFWWLRHVPVPADPLFYGYLEILGGVIALACAGSALVRFRGSHDRVSLLAAFGYLLAGSISTATSLSFFALSGPGLGAGAHVPLGWILSQTLLAGMLVAALLVEQRLRFARKPNREIIGTLAIGVGFAYVATYLLLHSIRLIRAGESLPRPWQMFPAIVFLIAAVGYARRLRTADSAFDHALCYGAALNVACHMAASLAESLFGPLFVFAEIAKVSSYAIVLGGALVDSGRLFEEVQRLAASDPLTGLANYRRLLNVLDSEIKRCQRSGRSFAVLLLDLDHLKAVNDRYGHLEGSRALVRLANVLRVYCRETDTSARYGGDEFALVLPETVEEAARLVASRIRVRLANDGEQPPLSVSVGVAVYPRDGATIEKLLNAADEALYEMKLGVRRSLVTAGGAGWR